MRTRSQRKASRAAQAREVERQQRIAACRRSGQRRVVEGGALYRLESGLIEVVDTSWDRRGARGTCTDVEVIDVGDAHFLTTYRVRGWGSSGLDDARAGRLPDHRVGMKHTAR